MPVSNTLASGSAQTPAGAPENSNVPDPAADPAAAPDPAADAAAADAAGAPGAGADPASDPAADPDGDASGDDDSGGGRRRVGQRIAEVVAERNATAEWGKHWFEVAQRLMQGQPNATGATAPQPTAAADAPVSRPPPKLTDFPAGDGRNYDALKWSEELAKWNDEQLEVRTVQAIEKRLSARDQKVEQEIAATTWVTRVAEIKKTEPNFDALVGNPTLPITKPMSAFIYRSPVGPQLAVHLAKNPAECARISLLKPDQIPLALARLEGRIESAPPPAAGARPAAAPRQQSRAPAPPSPNRGGGVASINLETCSLDDYLAERLPKMRR